MPKTLNALLEQCEIIADQLEGQHEESHPSEILQTALSLEFTIDAGGNYLGANILVAFGGPNIWIDTRYDRIDGYWGGEHVTKYYSDDNELHDYCEALFG